jgi:hypothetical protein
MKKKNKEESQLVSTQYAFRAGVEEIATVQRELKALHVKFNRGRDSDNPRGVQAVKMGEISLGALKLGIEILKKQDKWISKKRQG